MKQFTYNMVNRKYDNVYLLTLVLSDLPLQRCTPLRGVASLHPPPLLLRMQPPLSPPPMGSLGTACCPLRSHFLPHISVWNLLLVGLRLEKILCRTCRKILKIKLICATNYQMIIHSIYQRTKLNVFKMGRWKIVDCKLGYFLVEPWWCKFSFNIFLYYPILPTNQPPTNQPPTTPALSQWI